MNDKVLEEKKGRQERRWKIELGMPADKDNMAIRPVEGSYNKSIYRSSRALLLIMNVDCTV